VIYKNMRVNGVALTKKYINGIYRMLATHAILEGLNTLFFSIKYPHNGVVAIKIYVIINANIQEKFI
jgi:hypothetical protein